MATMDEATCDLIGGRAQEYEARRLKIVEQRASERLEAAVAYMDFNF